ncbi:MAG: hypothetical protein IJU51_07245, partial [Clostridia bacterium]|nr:hypothetical protein [Clostridia bacterium]
PSFGDNVLLLHEEKARITGHIRKHKSFFSLFIVLLLFSENGVPAVPDLIYGSLFTATTVILYNCSREH